MSAIKGSQLRIGGLNSGLDTEAIVNAMSASTKLRITTNQRKVLKLQAQQEAYRSIIDRFNSFKSKYFDSLNGDTWLRSRTTFNRHMAKITQNGVEAKPVGINISTNANATAGNYKVTVEGFATQAKLTSKPTDSLTSTAFKPDDFTDSSKTYAMQVTVGGTTRVISFKGGTDTEVVESINKSLQAFGKTNNTDREFLADGVTPNPGFGKGRVYFDDVAGKFVSTEQSAISTGVVSELKDTMGLGNLTGWDTGNNSLTLVIDGQSRPVTFWTVANDYFSNIKDFTEVVDGRLVLKQETLTPPAATAAQAEKDAYAADLKRQADEREIFSVFNRVISDMYDKERLDNFDAWKNHTGYNENYKTLTLTSDQKRQVLEGLQDIDFNYATVTAGIPAGEGYEAAASAAIDKFISELPPGQRGGVYSALDARLLTEMKLPANMSAQQLALFEAEVVRRNAATHQSEYNAALLKSYTAFDTWQRSLGIGMFMPNPGHDPDDPDSPATIENPEYVMYDKWLDIMGLSKDVIDMERLHGANWMDGIESRAMANITDLPFYAKLSNEDKAVYEIHLGAWEATFKSHSTLAENGEIDELMFLRGAYHETTAFFTQYSEKGVRVLNTESPPQIVTIGINNGRTLNEFMVATYNAPSFDPTHMARVFNEASINGAFNNVNFPNNNLAFPNGTKVEANIAADGTVTLKAFRETTVDGVTTRTDVDMGAFANANSTNDTKFGLITQETTVSTVSQSTLLSELGLKPNQETGRYTFEINGVTFSFDDKTTIRQMMSTVNANAKAGVEMTFSTLTNTFEIKSRQFGADVDMTWSDGAEGLLGALGFTGQTLQKGTNMELTINGQRVETASNSYEVNGTVITVGPNAVLGAAGTFDIVVERDTSQVLDIIKQFVKDYNELIDFVFGYVNEKPDKEYYFLTDADKEELGLSDRQEQKWEERAMKGLLYNDRVITGLMANMRTAMFSGIDRGDGTMFGLFSMGITTSSNWRDNGKLVITAEGEKRLMAAIENDIDMITELFTNAQNGIMPKLQEIIDSAVKTTGERWERGLLVQRAGMANQSSVTSNAIYDQIKRLNDIIGNLELRYQKQQDRYWKIFSALETQMGQLNAQTDYITQMAGANMWGGNRR
jgi:flagellar capping protein FliD